MAIDYELQAEFINEQLEEYGLKANAMPRTMPSDAPSWAKNCNAWRVTITYRRNAMTITYYTGSGITRTPNTADVIESLSGDYYLSQDLTDLDEFHRNLGGDSLKDTIKAYKALHRYARGYARLMGSPGAIDEVAQMVADY